MTGKGTVNLDHERWLHSYHASPMLRDAEGGREHAHLALRQPLLPPSAPPALSAASPCIAATSAACVAATSTASVATTCAAAATSSATASATGEAMGVLFFCSPTKLLPRSCVWL